MIPLGTLIGPPVPIVAGDAFNLQIQCYIKPTGTVPAKFKVGDTLAASVYRKGVRTPVFAPAVTWYTAPDDFGTATQTGYDQGQVYVFGTSAQSETLIVGHEYTLEVDWTPSSDPNNTQSIVQMILAIGRPF